MKYRPLRKAIYPHCKRAPRPRPATLARWPTSGEPWADPNSDAAAAAPPHFVHAQEVCGSVAGSDGCRSS